MVAKITDLQLGEALQGLALMPTITTERVTLKLIEKRQAPKGDKFEAFFMGISIGRFVAEPKGGHVEWRRENKISRAGRAEEDAKRAGRAGQ
jgi:hypothetical protein